LTLLGEGLTLLGEGLTILGEGLTLLGEGLTLLGDTLTTVKPYWRNADKWQKNYLNLSAVLREFSGFVKTSPKIFTPESTFLRERLTQKIRKLENR